MNYANEHHRLLIEALNTSNKEKPDMRLLTEARPEEIRSLNAKVKSVDEVVV